VKQQCIATLTKAVQINEALNTAFCIAALGVQTSTCAGDPPRGTGLAASSKHHSFSEMVASPFYGSPHIV